MDYRYEPVDTFDNSFGMMDDGLGDPFDAPRPPPRQKPKKRKNKNGRVILGFTPKRRHIWTIIFSLFTIAYLIAVAIIFGEFDADPLSTAEREALTAFSAISAVILGVAQIAIIFVAAVKIAQIDSSEQKDKEESRPRQRPRMPEDDYALGAAGYGGGAYGDDLDDFVF